MGGSNWLDFQFPLTAGDRVDLSWAEFLFTFVWKLASLSSLQEFNTANKYSDFFPAIFQPFSTYLISKWSAFWVIGNSFIKYFLRQEELLLFQPIGMYSNYSHWADATCFRFCIWSSALHRQNFVLVLVWLWVAENLK